MNHEVAESTTFVWVYCSVSEEIGWRVRSKKRKYQSVDNLDYSVLLSYATNGCDHDLKRNVIKSRIC